MFVSPKKFLTWLGWILLILGIAGFLMSNFNILYSRSFDVVENWARILLGIVALAIAYGVKDALTNKWVVVIFSVIALVVGIWGFMAEDNLGLVDNISHLIIGVWGLVVASFNKNDGN